MGKSPKSKQLRVGVHEVLDQWPEIQELRDKGHEVKTLEIQDYDLVLGPNCWRMAEPLRKYLDNAVKAARAAKKG